MFNINPSIINTRYLVIVVASVACILTLTTLILLCKEEIPVDEILTTEVERELQEEVGLLVGSGDIKACDAVQNDMYKKVCINNIALKKAGESNDITYCQYIDGELIPKENCERQVIFRKSIEGESKLGCSETYNISLRKECEDSFASRIAEEKEDSSFCDEDPDSIIADQCWNKYYANRISTMYNKDGELNFNCEIFRGDNEKADCKVVSEVIRESNPEKIMETCQAQKTEIFFEACMLSLQKVMR